MNNVDTVRAVMQAWSVGDATLLGSMITDDFTFSGAVPQPLGKAEFLDLCKVNHTAFPDWDFHAHGFHEAGDTVYAKGSITATHSGTLAVISAVPPVPATGKRIALPEEDYIFTLRDGKVRSVDVQSPPNGSFPGAYAQVGAPLPAM